MFSLALNQDRTSCDEKSLSERNLRVTLMHCTVVLCCSSQMAAAAVEALCGKAEIWIYRCDEGGYATGACEEDNPRSWRHE